MTAVPCDRRNSPASPTWLPFGDEFEVLSLATSRRENDPTGARFVTIKLNDDDTLTILLPGGSVRWTYANPPVGEPGKRTIRFIAPAEGDTVRRAVLHSTDRQDFPM